MFKIVTDTGRVIKVCETERQADNFWESLNGVWTDYDDNNKEYNIYIEEA